MRKRGMIRQKDYINGLIPQRQKMRIDAENCFDIENKDYYDDVDQFGYHDEHAADTALGYDPDEDGLYNFVVEMNTVSVAGIL